MIIFIESLFNYIVPYDDKLGTYKNIIAYSSHNKLYDLENNYIDNHYCGLKWQCVELIRRYLIIKYNISFQQIDNAYEIFNLDHFYYLKTNKKIKIYKIPNGSLESPKVGSILVWSKEYKGTGHVAIVTDIKNDHIKIIEQNWNNKKWRKNYSRKIPYIYHHGFYMNEDILGWINY